MAKPNTTLLVNITSNDGVNSGGASGGLGGSSSNWMVVNPVSDFIVWTGEEQQNNDSITGDIYPVPIPLTGATEGEKTFLWSDSLGVLKQIPLAGTAAGKQSGGDNRYVFAMYFDGATTSIPYLECWDNSNYLTADNPYLNTSGESCIRAVATTNSAPGSAVWLGTHLRGVVSRVALDDAAVSAAKNLYWNMKLSIPSGFAAATYTSARFVVRYLYS